jgi:FixJ family two-component response regulator
MMAQIPRLLLNIRGAEQILRQSEEFSGPVSTGTGIIPSSGENQGRIVFARILLVENEAESIEYYERKLRERGFNDIVCFSDTTNMAARVAEAYTCPCIMLSDYYISPKAPSRFLPELKDKGIEMPVIIMSGDLRADELNFLQMHCKLRGFFEKGSNPTALMQKVAHHIMDLHPEAIEAWEAYSVALEARQLLKNLTMSQLDIMLRLLEWEEVKAITKEADVGESAIYNIRRQMKSFMGRDSSPHRYPVLHREVRRRVTSA